MISITADTYRNNTTQSSSRKCLRDHEFLVIFFYIDTEDRSNNQWTTRIIVSTARRYVLLKSVTLRVQSSKANWLNTSMRQDPDWTDIIWRQFLRSFADVFIFTLRADVSTCIFLQSFLMNRENIFHHRKVSRIPQRSTGPQSFIDVSLVNWQKVSILIVVSFFFVLKFVAFLEKRWNISMVLRLFVSAHWFFHGQKWLSTFFLFDFSYF